MTTGLGGGVADLRVEGLCAGYPGHPVLRELTVRLPGGRVTAVVGPNGSGKSTLLEVLAGVLTPSAGRVSGPGVGAPAYVPQRSAVPDGLPLTVHDTVAMARWAHRGLWRRLTTTDFAVIEACLDRLGLADLAGRQLGELSGGQRQRALVAQGLAREAPLMLLDEPCAGLDERSRALIDRAIWAERDRGRTVVLSTHDPDQADAADHCVLLGSGAVIIEGPPATVLAKADLSTARRSNSSRRLPEAN